MGLFPTLATIALVAALLPVSTGRQTQSGTVTGILRTSAGVPLGFPDNDGRFSMLLAPGEIRLFTENLNTSRHSIQSISDGAADPLNAPFVFDGSRHPEIRITLAP